MTLCDRGNLFSGSLPMAQHRLGSLADKSAPFPPPHRSFFDAGLLFTYNKDNTIRAVVSQWGSNNKEFPTGLSQVEVLPILEQQVDLRPFGAWRQRHRRDVMGLRGAYFPLSAYNIDEPFPYLRIISRLN